MLSIKTPIIETPPNSGLTIVRRGIDPMLARDVQLEMEACLDKVGLNTYHTPEARVITLPTGALSSFHENQYPATQRALRDLGQLGVKGNDRSLSVNFQPPRGKQVFHPDYTDTRERVMVIHGADGGAFDYAPRAKDFGQAVRNHKTIEELNAGDVVYQARPNAWHRGRNTSDKPRVTIAARMIR